MKEHELIEFYKKLCEYNNCKRNLILYYAVDSISDINDISVEEGSLYLESLSIIKNKIIVKMEIDEKNNRKHEILNVGEIENIIYENCLIDFLLINQDLFEQLECKYHVLHLSYLLENGFNPIKLIKCVSNLSTTDMIDFGQEILKHYDEDFRIKYNNIILANVKDCIVKKKYRNGLIDLLYEPSTETIRQLIEYAVRINQDDIVNIYKFFIQYDESNTIDIICSNIANISLLEQIIVNFPTLEKTALDYYYSDENLKFLIAKYLKVYL